MDTRARFIKLTARNAASHGMSRQFTHHTVDIFETCNPYISNILYSLVWEELDADFVRVHPTYCTDVGRYSIYFSMDKTEWDIAKIWTSTISFADELTLQYRGRV